MLCSDSVALCFLIRRVDDADVFDDRFTCSCPSALGGDNCEAALAAASGSGSGGGTTAYAVIGAVFGALLLAVLIAVYKVIMSSMHVLIAHLVTTTIASVHSPHTDMPRALTHAHAQPHDLSYADTLANRQAHCAKSHLCRHEPADCILHSHMRLHCSRIPSRVYPKMRAANPLLQNPV